MAKTSAHAPAPFSLSSFASLIAQSVRSAMQELKRGREANRRIQTYWAMSDEDLRTRGIERADIIRLVMAEVI